jgi:hypothetical protein
MNIEFCALKGQVLQAAYQVGEDEIRFITLDDRKFRMYHTQDCCENVYIESIVGSLDDLLGRPILLAEETSGDMENVSESGTWTFYKLATIAGYVDIRWNGQSNGYYSESVDFVEVEAFDD